MTDEQTQMIEKYMAGFRLEFRADPADPAWALVSVRVPRMSEMADTKWEGAQAAAEFFSMCSAIVAAQTAADAIPEADRAGVMSAIAAGAEGPKS